MLNQYRTLLLNQTDLGNPDEYISPNFTSLNLPIQLKQFYTLLFPNGISRYYTQFLAFCYLQTLRASNQEQFVYGLDNRVTYRLNEISDYFLVNQTSAPTVSNPDYPLHVFGQYAVNSSVAKNYEDILISQLSTIYVSMFSRVNNVYYNQTSSSPVLTPAFEIKISSNLTNLTSDLINIGNTGLSFSIAGSLLDLSETSGLNWEFTAQAPFNFDFNDLYTKLLSNLPTVNAMLSFNPVINDTHSLNLWSTHYNPIYRFAGLLNCFVLQVNNII